jgi:hypothetical protein
VKDKRNAQAVELKNKQPFYPTVAYREFCSFTGDLTVAIRIEETPSRLESLLLAIGYFGKRGSFFQFSGMDYVEEIPEHFTFPLENPPDEFNLGVVVQPLDDLGSKATFDAISTYSPSSARLGRDRTIVQTAVPYKLVSSSRGYTLYRRSG